jgi:hypothetical protein
MSSTALTKSVNSSRLSVIAEKVLCLLEKVSDESFWSSFFSERVLNLLKRYFGSDVIFLGMIVYIARKYFFLIMFEKMGSNMLGT